MPVVHFVQPTTDDRVPSTDMPPSIEGIFGGGGKFGCRLVGCGWGVGCGGFVGCGWWVGCG